MGEIKKKGEFFFFQEKMNEIKGTKRKIKKPKLDNKTTNVVHAAVDRTVSLISTEFGFTGFYLVLPSFIGVYLVLPSFTLSFVSICVK